MGLPLDGPDPYQQTFEIPFSHAQVTAGLAAKLWKAPRTARVTLGTEYLNPTGLVEHADNHYTVAIANVSNALVVADFTFTGEADDDLLTATAHGLLTGDGPIRVANSGGALPTGLAAATDYYAIRVSANTLSLAVSRTAAYAGAAIDLTGDGSGTHTLSDTASTVRPLIVASYSTDADGAGTNTLSPNTWTALALSATDADLIIEAGEELALLLIEGGTATLPAGSGFVRGRFVA